jgi:DNA-3-methyladenine glycosylase I
VPMKRCDWVPAGDELYVHYHDEEWGVPVRDERRLFEMLCLEGAQAGLSWRTILGRRESYRDVFAGFDPHVVARFTDERLAAILRDERIVRNRLKVSAVRENARAVLGLGDTEGGLNELLWSFVGGAPVDRRVRGTADVPPFTPEAEAMSKALRKLGFRFVGPTICYAFMQAVGMVNDHLLDCFRHDEVGGGTVRP